MRRFHFALMVALLILGFNTARAQEDSNPYVPLTVVAKFPGSTLRWIGVAMAEFEKRHLELDRYNITIADLGDNVAVMAQAVDAPPHSFGSSGSVPAYEVEIRKIDLQIVTSHYDR
jgi:hypothetical protein